MTTDLNDPHQEKPETAGYQAFREARSLGMDGGQTSGLIVEATLAAVWRNAQRMYGGSDLDHVDCDSGACNLCILKDFAAALGRPHFALELTPGKGGVR